MSIASIGWYGIRGPVTAVRRHLWLMVVPAAALAGLLLGYLAAARQPILYEGVARVLLAEQTGGDRGAPPDDPDRTVRNQASIVSSTPVLEDAAGRYGNGITLDVIRKRVTVEASTASNLITIRVLDPTPEGAAKLADLVVQAFEGVVGGQSAEDTEATIERLAMQKAALQVRIQRIKVAQDREGRDDPALRAELAATTGTLQQVVTRELQLTGGRNLPGAIGGLRESPEVSQTPAQPKPKRTMTLGALLGLAAGGAAVAWRLAVGRRAIAAAVNGSVKSRAVVSAVSSPAGGDQRTRPPARPFRWFTLLLGLLLVGYMFFSKSFAYLTKVPGTPVFAGEIVLAIGLIEAVRARSVIRLLLKASPSLRVLLALIAFTGIRLLWDLPTHGMDAIRDYSIFYYGSIAFLVAAAAMSDQTFTPRLLRWYRRILPWFLLWVPIAIFLARHRSLATVNIPGSTTPINTFKGSDLVIMTTMALVLLWLGLDRIIERRPTRRSDDLLTVLGVFALLVLISQGRAALVVIPAMFGTMLLFLPNNRRRRIVLATIGSLVIVLVPVWLLNLQLQVGGRELSLQQVKSNVASIISRGPQRNEAETGLQGTVRWRQELFGTVLDKSLSSDRALTGRGFGPILSYEYLRQPPAPGAPPPLRSAHNSHLTVLARTGLPCFGLWVLLWVVWFRDVGRVARPARHGLRSPAGLAVWLLAGVVGLLVVSFYDPTLETPQGAIWLWTMVGLAVAHTLMASQRAMEPESERHADKITLQ